MLRFKDVPEKAADTFYRTAMDNPKTASAVILGTGLAATRLRGQRQETLTE